MSIDPYTEYNIETRCSELSKILQNISSFDDLNRQAARLQVGGERDWERKLIERWENIRIPSETITDAFTRNQNYSNELLNRNLDLRVNNAPLVRDKRPQEFVINQGNRHYAFDPIKQEYSSEVIQFPNSITILLPTHLQDLVLQDFDN